MKSKRIFTTLLALFLMLTAFPLTVSAAGNDEYRDGYYTLGMVMDSAGTIFVYGECEDRHATHKFEAILEVYDNANNLLVSKTRIFYSQYKFNFYLYDDDYPNSDTTDYAKCYIYVDDKKVTTLRVD